MKIVIDIPEEEYKECKNRFDMIYQEEGYLNYNLNTALVLYVANGTPLPKNHGRLIDADTLEADLIEPIRYPDGDVIIDGYGYSREQIKEAPTIIEADKEE